MPAEITEDHLQRFQGDLVDWYRASKRVMPWRGSEDPYRIWLSEVMLQQTRVDQAKPYYNRFVKAFPTLRSLAEADQEDVLKLWEGLGYYRRARYLHEASKMVVQDHGGKVPANYNDFRALPGVGPYTAAAVLSIAYGMPHAVVDGNVKRVLTRVFAIEGDVGRSQTKRQIQKLADELLPDNIPADFNQALMELGARVCTPMLPSCPDCPLARICKAFRRGTPTVFPVKKKKKAVPHHDIVVVLITKNEHKILIQKRPQDAMLGGLWEFPGGKREQHESLIEACKRESKEELGITISEASPIFRLKHTYSHFRITLHAFSCEWTGQPPVGNEGQPLRWVNFGELDEYAFPRANRKLIEHLKQEQQQPSLLPVTS